MVLNNICRKQRSESPGHTDVKNVRQLNAFTLVELLVVIAIISILAGMLLPVLENAIESSKGISCIGKLKQFNMATSFYLDDFDGYYMKYDGWSSDYKWTWQRLLAEYLGEQEYSYTGDIFRCPSESNSQSYYYGQNGNIQGYKLSEIENNSGTFLFGDSDGYSSAISDFRYIHYIPRHSGFINTAFCDGHTEAIEDIIIKELFTPEND